MKRIIALGLSTILLVPVISTTVAFAVEGTETPPTSTTVKPETDTTAEAAKKALAERIQARKTELKTKLSNAEKTRLQARCKASQGLISSVEGRVKGLETSRGKVYANMISRLTDLSTKLQNKSIDTTELDTAIDDLQTKINTFNTDLLAYKQAVNDLVAIDCVADPDGFKASLESARAAQAKVNTDALAVRAQLNDVIKPILKSIRAQLEPKAEDSADTGGGQ